MTRHGLLQTGLLIIGLVGFGILPGCGATEDAPAPPAPAEALGQGLDAQVQNSPVAIPADIQNVPAWKQFVKEVGADWKAHVNAETNVPQRIYGAGISVPNSVNDGSIAEAYARVFLERHVALLAPGSHVDDFVQVTNHISGGIRSIGFIQHAKGLPVLTGQVSFRFKNDRLFVIASEAQPNVAIEVPSKPLADTDAKEQALAWVLEEVPGSDVRVGAVEGPFVLPFEDEHHVVLRVKAASDAPLGRWDVFLNAEDGTRIQRKQTLMFETAALGYNAPVRDPSGERRIYATNEANVIVGDDAQTTDFEGMLSWTGDATTVEVTATSDSVRVHTDEGDPATAILDLMDGAELVWSAEENELVDAQITTFVHLNAAKTYVKAFASDMRWLDSQVEALVNIQDECNAVSDGTHVYFFQSSDFCENTGRIADVVYHEFGHSFHNHAIVRGVGAFEGSLSEGVSDYLAATITNDSGMGPGFFKGNNRPLRQIDPVGSENVWPDDVISGDVHHNGLIIGGALWDLRKGLIEKLGPEAGVRHADMLYYQGIQRASDIPTMYIEILAGDDDDGDLSNGTPNVCNIVEAFARHGLASLGVEGSPANTELPEQGGFRVALKQDAAFLQCAEDSGASITWQLRTDPTIQGTVAMTSTDGYFEGIIPTQAKGEVVQYKVTLNALGSNRDFPDNPADPLYEFYVGETKPIYCTSFDQDDPEGAGWSHGLESGEASEGADDWQWGPAGGKGFDPSAAHSAPNLFGNDIGPDDDYNGLYQANKVNFAQSPKISVEGYDRVRLQYVRWLTVEDATYDTASIYANGDLVWQNSASRSGEVHHIDREWRFHDVDLSEKVSEDSVQIKFEIASDGGLELGGWNLDNFCIVGVEAVCGDGRINTPSELCDNGGANSDNDPDACRTSCQLAQCGDGVIDLGEACDDGNQVAGDGCSPSCTLSSACEEGVFGGECDEGTGNGDGPGIVTAVPEGEDDSTVQSAGSGNSGCSQTQGQSPELPGAIALLLMLGIVIVVRRQR